jgi:hypothetical protein
VNPLRAADGEELSNVLEPPVLEDAREDPVGVPRRIETVEVDAPEEPAHALG